MSSDFIFVFSMTVLIASIIPGPSMLLALTHGMQYGAKKTISSAMGNMTITIIQALISIAGLGTILIASEFTFQIIKYIGAAYLIYLGIGILFFSKMSLAQGQLNYPVKIISLKRMYWQSAMVTAGNPKAVVFFTAVFPQFIDPNKSYMSQSFVLISICALIAFCCFMFYALSGQRIVIIFSKAKIWKYVKIIIGGSFIGTGIGLSISNK